MYDFGWSENDKHLAYETRELAEGANELAKAKWRVKKRIYELNGNEKIDIKDNTPNWTFVLSEKRLERLSVIHYKIFPSWQCLKTKELVDQLLEEMYDDCMLIVC